MVCKGLSLVGKICISIFIAFTWCTLRLSVLERKSMRHLRLGSVVTSLSFSWNNMFTLLFNMGLLMSTHLMGLMAYTDLTDMKMKIRSLMLISYTKQRWLIQFLWVLSKICKTYRCKITFGYCFNLKSTLEFSSWVWVM